MTNPRGRPAGIPTDNVRIHRDLAEKVAGLTDLLQLRAADLLDPIIRPQIEAMYDARRGDIEAMQRLRQKGQQADPQGAGNPQEPRSRKKPRG